MTNALYYTFSTIAQTLAGAVALLAAFLLYRLAGLNRDIDEYAERITGAVSGLHGKVREWFYAHEYVKILEAASHAAFPPGHYKAEDERARLPALLAQKRSIMGRFRASLYLTAGLITFSVLALVATPYIALSSWLTWVVFAVGIGGLATCMVSYVLVLRAALS